MGGSEREETDLGPPNPTLNSLSPSTPTLSSLAFNLFIAAAGAGLLSFPFAHMQQGILITLICTLLFAGLTVFTDCVLIQTAALFRRELVSAGRPTFDGLAHAALGKRQGDHAALAVVLGTIGGLIGYFIVLGDVLVGPIRAWCGGGPPCAVLGSRALLVPLLAFCVILPLAALPAMSRLGHSSLLGTVTVLFVGAVVGAKGVVAAAGGGLEAVGATRGAPGADAPPAVVLSRWAFSPFVLGVPVAIFALGNHTQVVPLFLEAPRGSAASRGVLRAVLAAVGACVALYTLTGAAGYVAFRGATKGDVLLNLGDDGVGAAAQAVLALHILCAFPVMMFPGRESVREGARAAAAALRGGGAGAGAGEAGAGAGAGGGGALRGAAVAALDALAGSPLAAAAALVLSTACASVLFPQVSVVFGLVGATVATYECHFLPGVYLLRWADAMEGRGHARWAGAAERWGRAAPASEEGAAERPLLAAQRPAAEGAEGGEPRLLATDKPRLLRAQGRALIAASVAVAVCGTGTYVYSTWLS
jgi:amino acid permease